VLDRSDSCNGGFAPVYSDVATAFQTHLGPKAPKMINYVYGLGGREISLEHLRDVYEKLESIKNGGKAGETLEYINVRK